MLQNFARKNRLVIKRTMQNRQNMNKWDTLRLKILKKAPKIQLAVVFSKKKLIFAPDNKV